jgi:hypothetical protein
MMIAILIIVVVVVVVVVVVFRCILSTTRDADPRTSLLPPRTVVVFVNASHLQPIPPHHVPRAQPRGGGSAARG